MSETKPSSTMDNNNTTNTTLAPDELQKLPLQQQLWYFIDDVIPTDDKSTEVVCYDMGFNENEQTILTELFPKSMEIFDEISYAPAHAQSKYPDMVPYFPIIQTLDNTFVSRNINPIWEATPMGIPQPVLTSIFLSNRNGQKLYLHRNPVQGGLPFRLIYGDFSHEHDFVGIVYLTDNP